MLTDITVLRRIYDGALARCAPEILTAEAVAGTGMADRGSGTPSPHRPRRAPPASSPLVDVVALGKCAAGLVEGIGRTLPVGRALVAVPAGYRTSLSTPFEVETTIGGHPQFSAESFASGRRVMEFVRQSERPLVFAISGGSSACAEVPLAPWFTESDLAAMNRLLVSSGLPIGEMNVVRKHLSAMKGGRLAAHAREPHLTLVYSDVATGRLADVGSGPTMADPSTLENAALILEALGDSRAEAIASVLRQGGVPDTVKDEPAPAVCVADNTTLVLSAAAEVEAAGLMPRVLGDQIEGTVDEAAERLWTAATQLRAGEILVAGGEPTVVVRGGGRGGRCSELAARLLVRARPGSLRMLALLGSSDGQDGNSGVAGLAVDLSAAAVELDAGAIAQAIHSSDTFGLLQPHAGAIIIPPTGNNLRDLYLLARG